MASTTEPLLNTPKKSVFICKFLYIALPFVALLVSAVFLASNLSKTTQNDVSNLSHICQRALHPETCLDFVSQAVSSGFETKDTTVVLEKLLMKEAHLMKNASFQARNLRNQINEQTEQGALSDCLELLDMSFDRVLDSIKAIRDGTRMSRADARTWLSGVLTNHVTCFDGLKNSSKKSMETFLEDLILRASASLAILATVSEPDTEFTVLSALGGMLLLPPWITTMDKILLKTSANEIKADITVAKDGSGNYKTVAEALKAAPTNSKTRYVIYVKKGTYKENVEVASNKKNLMIIGDGMDSTTITGSRSVGGGSSTFNSFTLAAVGDGFILQDIGIKNTAGAAMDQAVALRVGADKSVINRCRIDAFQDTLYAHSQRQFFNDCYITGTVDFIFGNSAVVFQKCKLATRKPMAKQQNMVTAQGRTDPNQNTGTSIQGCDIIASSDLKPVQSSFRTFLGRPWKKYSRTVVMQSNIGSLIDPAGWSKWNGGDVGLKTLYYGEYQNQGAGAGTSKRVKWPGYHVITKSSDAMKFTVKELIQGRDWLGSTGVSYTEGLM